MAVDIVGANLNDGGSFIDIMKRLQPPKNVERLWALRYPALAKTTKVGDFFGTQRDCPLEHDHPAASRTFADAQSERFPSSSVKYSLTRAKDYATGRLDAETMHASSNEKGAWLRALQREQANTLMTLQKRTAIALYRNHGGSIGRMGSVIDVDGTNDVLVLENKSDVINFSRGQALNFATTDGTSGSILTGDAYVSKLDFDNGYIHIAASPTALGTPGNYATIVTGESETEYIFNKGDFGVAFRGFESWIPLTAPSSGEDFLGIDRSVDPMRLSGHRINDTSLSYEELVQELAARITYSSGGGMPDLVCYMAPMQVKQFALEMGVKVVRDPGGTAKTGFRGIMVDTVAGSIEVLGDPACPENRMFLLDMSTWKFHHLKGLPHLVEDDGLARLRVADADQVAFRYRLWGNLACTAPGRNGVAALPQAF